MERTALTEILFACYKAGEITGKRLNYTIPADPDEQRRAFELLCAAEIRMALAYADLQKTFPVPDPKHEERIKDEIEKSGLLDLLWRLFQEENKNEI